MVFWKLFYWTGENLENTTSSAPTIDEVSKGRIEALARKSQFYGWKVSKKQILRVGPEEFEKHLTKQRTIIYKLRVIEEKAKLISLRFMFPVLPLSSKDADVFAKRVNGALRKIYKTIPETDPETETTARTMETLSEPSHGSSTRSPNFCGASLLETAR